MPELKLGYQGPLYNPWYDWAARKYSKRAFLLGARDGYYGSNEAQWTSQIQREFGLVIDGKFGDRTAAATGFTWPGASGPPIVQARRPITFYSCPGSGSDYWMGPSHDVGEMLCGRNFNEPGRQSLNINHQPVSFQKGGYLGLMGGDSTFSYIDVINDQKASIRSLLQSNGDLGNPKGELWFSGYSQSADGLLEAILDLFGDGGQFFDHRNKINGLICFGNPATPVTGIARKTFPAWLNKLVFQVNATNDFYAVAKDKIRPAFYAEIIKAEMELPFFVHLLRVAIPIIEAWAELVLPFLAPLLGGFGPMVQLGLGAINGLQGIGNSSDFGRLLGMAGSGDDWETTNKIRDILSPTGLLASIPDLIALIAALPGLQAHNGYHAICPPRPEFGNRVGTQYAYDHIASFRR